jgi:hypothetical protein
MHAPVSAFLGESMKLHVPNMWLFLVAAFLAVLGMIQHLSVAVPGLSTESAAWLMFCGWFLLALATVLSGESKQAA